MVEWVQVGLLAGILLALLWNMARDWLLPELRQRWRIRRKK